MLAFAIALPIWTDLCIAMPLLFNSEHCISLPSHYISMLFAATALLLYQNHHIAIAKRFLTSLHFSYAFYLLAMPLPRNSIFTSQYRCESTRSALCHCHTTLNPRGVYFGVSHRSGPRNMALVYRFHHNQVWQLPHDGADDVDLVHIRIRVPDSLTDLDSVSPSFDRRHRPADVFIR